MTIWGDEGFSACHTHHVIPVKTGIQCTASAVQKTIPAGRIARRWNPASAGMTWWAGRTEARLMLQKACRYAKNSPEKRNAAFTSLPAFACARARAGA